MPVWTPAARLHLSREPGVPAQTHKTPARRTLRCTCPRARAPLLTAPRGTHALAHAPRCMHAQARGSHSPVGVLEVDVDFLCRSEELWQGEKRTARQRGAGGSRGRDPGRTAAVMWPHLQVSFPTKVSAPRSSAARAGAQRGAMRGCPSLRAAAGRRARGGWRWSPGASPGTKVSVCPGLLWVCLGFPPGLLRLAGAPAWPRGAQCCTEPLGWGALAKQGARRAPPVPQRVPCPCSPLTQHCPTPSPRLPVWENKPPRGNPISTTKKDGARFT